MRFIFFLLSLTFYVTQAGAFQTYQFFDLVAKPTLQPVKLGCVAALKGVPVRRIQDLRQVRIMQYNYENFYHHVGEFERQYGNTQRQRPGRGPVEKPAEKIEEMGRFHRELNPDFIFGEEIEGADSVDRFNKEQLGDQYATFYFRGNDERGIAIEFMVKKDLAINLEFETFEHALWLDPLDGQKHHLFSRDFAVIKAIDPETGEVRDIFMGVHAKSKRHRFLKDAQGQDVLRNGRPVADYESKSQREAQFLAMRQIRDEYMRKYPNAKIITAGDMNGDVATSPEIQDTILQDGLLKDAFDLVHQDDRVTFTLHLRHRGVEEPAKPQQLDAILLSPNAFQAVQRVFVYRYKNPDGSPKPLPTNYATRELNPSDHFPVILDLDGRGFWGP
jgi:hypothetical protein